MSVGYCKNRFVYKSIKQNKDILKNTSQCITYILSKEEIEEYLQKYNLNNK